MCIERNCYDAAEINRKFEALPEEITHAIWLHGKTGEPPVTAEAARSLLASKSWAVAAYEAATRKEL